MRIVLWVMAAVFMQPLAASSGAAAVQQAASATKPTLDFDYFRTQVQPVFLGKRQGFTRCVVCHTGGGQAGFLVPLPPGATEWTEEQSRKNFETVSRYVVAGQPMKSRLLTHPLEPSAGGDEFHNGGRQFSSQTDPQFLTIANWINGQTARGSQP